MRLSLALRLVLTDSYPVGLNGDEPKNLSCTVQAVGRGEYLGESCNGPPYLLSAVFAAPLVPLTGPNRWAMRSYSMLLSVLATAAAFAVARAMGLRATAGLVAGGLVAVLPWALYYGRISLGGELIFHQLLLLAALARLIWPEAIARRTAPPGVELPPVDAGWREALLAGFALAMLLWDYTPAAPWWACRCFAALLATGRRRLWCLAVPLVGLVLWMPHLSTHPPYALCRFQHPPGLHDEVRSDPIPGPAAETPAVRPVDVRLAGGPGQHLHGALGRNAPDSSCWPWRPRRTHRRTPLPLPGRRFRRWHPARRRQPDVRHQHAPHHDGLRFRRPRHRLRQ